MRASRSVPHPSRNVFNMTTTGAAARAEYCGAFPGLSVAGARVPCTAGDCPTAAICRALRRLDQEAGVARGNRDAAARYVDGLLNASGPDTTAGPRLA